MGLFMVAVKNCTLNLLGVHGHIAKTINAKL